MHYADYKKFDFLNGKGLRHSLFVSGCLHHCKGCWNAIAWDFNYGNPYTSETEEMIISDLNIKEIKISGLSLLGGEPFEHTKQLTRLLKRVKTECKNKDIWCWTGFTFEEIMNDKDRVNMLQHIDVLVDGRFEIDKRDLTLKFRGSSNQRLINVQESLRQERIVLYDI